MWTFLATIRVDPEKELAAAVVRQAKELRNPLRVIIYLLRTAKAFHGTWVSCVNACRVSWVHKESWMRNAKGPTIHPSFLTLTIIHPLLFQIAGVFERGIVDGLAIQHFTALLCDAQLQVRGGYFDPSIEAITLELLEIMKTMEGESCKLMVVVVHGTEKYDLRELCCECGGNA